VINANGKTVGGVSKDVTALKAETASQWVNVKYPPAPLVAAIGNGVADDYTVIQAIIDAVSVSGGTVFLPAGTFLISQALSLKSGVNLVGQSVYITTLKTATNTINAIECVSGINWSSIKDLGIKSPSVGTSNTAIKYNDDNGGAENRIENVDMYKFYYGVSARDNWYSNTINCVKIWYPYIAFYFVYKTIGASINNTVSNVYIHQPSYVAVTIVSFKRLTMININVDTTLFPSGCSIDGNSLVSLIGCNFEGSAVTSGGYIVMVRGASAATLINCQLTPASSVATGYGLRIESASTMVTTINVSISTVANFRQVYTANYANSIFTNLSPNITDISNATGANAAALVNNLNGPKSANSQTIDLSGTQQDFIILSPTVGIRLKSVKLVYNEATSVDAGVVVTIKTSNARTISTITTEVSKAIYTSTIGTLTNAAVDAGTSLVVSCPGAKVGIGNCQVIVEYWNE
jgi:hypothetical protein